MEVGVNYVKITRELLGIYLVYRYNYQIYR